MIPNHKFTESDESSARSQEEIDCYFSEKYDPKMRDSSRSNENRRRSASISRNPSKQNNLIQNSPKNTSNVRKNKSYDGRFSQKSNHDEKSNQEYPTPPITITGSLSSSHHEHCSGDYEKTAHDTVTRGWSYREGVELLPKHENVHIDAKNSKFPNASSKTFKNRNKTRTLGIHDNRDSKHDPSVGVGSYNYNQNSEFLINESSLINAFHDVNKNQAQHIPTDQFSPKFVFNNLSANNNNSTSTDNINNIPRSIVRCVAISVSPEMLPENCSPQRNSNQCNRGQTEQRVYPEMKPWNSDPETFELMQELKKSLEEELDNSEVWAIYNTTPLRDIKKETKVPEMAMNNIRKFLWYDLKMQFLTTENLKIADVFGERIITVHELYSRKNSIQSPLEKHKKPRSWLDTFAKPEVTDEEVHFSNFKEILQFDDELFAHLQKKIGWFFGRLNSDELPQTGAKSLDQFRFTLKHEKTNSPGSVLQNSMTTSTNVQSSSMMSSTKTITANSKTTESMLSSMINLNQDSEIFIHSDQLKNVISKRKDCKLMLDRLLEIESFFPKSSTSIMNIIPEGVLYLNENKVVKCCMVDIGECRLHPPLGDLFSEKISDGNYLSNCKVVRPRVCVGPRQTSIGRNSFESRIKNTQKTPSRQVSQKPAKVKHQAHIEYFMNTFCKMCACDQPNIGCKVCNDAFSTYHGPSGKPNEGLKGFILLLTSWERECTNLMFSMQSLVGSLPKLEGNNLEENMFTAEVELERLGKLDVLNLRDLCFRDNPLEPIDKFCLNSIDEIINKEMIAGIDSTPKTDFSSNMDFSTKTDFFSKETDIYSKMEFSSSTVTSDTFSSNNSKIMTYLLKDFPDFMSRICKLSVFFEKWAKHCLFTLLRARRMFLDDGEEQDMNSGEERRIERDSFIASILSKVQCQALEDSPYANDQDEDLRLLENPSSSFETEKLNNTPNSQHRNEGTSFTHHDRLKNAGFPSLLQIYLFQVRLLLFVTKQKLDQLYHSYEVLKPIHIKEAGLCYDTMIECKLNLSDALKILDLFHYLALEIKLDDENRIALEKDTTFEEFKAKVELLFCDYYLKYCARWIQLSGRAELDWWDKDFQEQKQKNSQKQKNHGIQKQVSDFIHSGTQQPILTEPDLVINEWEFAAKAARKLPSKKATERLVITFGDIMSYLATNCRDIFKVVQEYTTNSKNTSNLFCQVKWAQSPPNSAKKEEISSMVERVKQNTFQTMRIFKTVHDSLNSMRIRSLKVAKKLCTKLQVAIPLRVMENRGSHAHDFLSPEGKKKLENNYVMLNIKNQFKPLKHRSNVQKSSKNVNFSSSSQKPWVIENYCTKCANKKLFKNSIEPEEKFDNEMIILISKQVFQNEQKDCVLKGVLRTIECLAGLLPECELEHDMCIQDHSCDAHVILTQSCLFEKSRAPKVKNRSKISSDTGMYKQDLDKNKSTTSADKRRKKKERKDRRKLKKERGDWSKEENGMKSDDGSVCLADLSMDRVDSLAGDDDAFSNDFQLFRRFSTPQSNRSVSGQTSYSGSTVSSSRLITRQASVANDGTESE